MTFRHALTVFPTILLTMFLAGCGPKRVAPPVSPAPHPEGLPAQPEPAIPGGAAPGAEGPPPDESPTGKSDAAGASAAEPSVGAAASGRHRPPVPLRLVAIGDVNFNRNRVEVRPDGIDLWGTVMPFAPLTDRLSGLIDGDVNFANLETVVTERNDFDPPEADKQFCFRSHPNGVKLLIESGFNLFCLANNHAYDYGDVGIRETLRHMKALAELNAIAYAGIGTRFEEASAPTLFTVKGIRIGMTAIGIGGRAGPDKPGVAHVSMHRAALERLRDADVDLRILSVHDGKEGILYPIDRQLLVSREAIRDYGVDLVLGHHPHRVQGVERYGDGLIFYSLGNGLMRGAADIGKKRTGDLYADFGLLARIDLEVDLEQSRVMFKRIEAVPLYGMHQQPAPLPAEEAAWRIDTLNRISRYGYLEQDWNKNCPPADRERAIQFNPSGSLGYVDLH